MKFAEKICLDVSENALVDEFFKDFFRAFWILPAETPLTHLELNLAENYFAAQTTESIQEGFKTFAALKNLQFLQLVLRKNSMTDQLASQIIQSITNLPKLNTFIVDLSNSREKIESLLHLDDHLRTSAESLAHFSVNIQGHPISDESIKLLIDSLESISPPLSIKNITILVDNNSITTPINLPNLNIINKISKV